MLLSRLQQALWTPHDSRRLGTTRLRRAEARSPGNVVNLDGKEEEEDSKDGEMDDDDEEKEGDDVHEEEEEEEDMEEREEEEEDDEDEDEETGEGIKPIFEPV